MKNRSPGLPDLSGTVEWIKIYFEVLAATIALLAIITAIAIEG